MYEIIAITKITYNWLTVAYRPEQSAEFPGNRYDTPWDETPIFVQEPSNPISHSIGNHVEHENAGALSIYVESRIPVALVRKRIAISMVCESVQLQNRMSFRRSFPGTPSKP